jgi:hypothetical protein
MKSALDASLESNVEIHIPSSLEEHVTINDINAVILKAVTTLQVIEQVDKSPAHKPFKNIMVQMAPFMSAVVSNFYTDQLQEKDNWEDHKRRLQCVVNSCGYKLCDVSPDGNCCFTAFSFGLLTQQDVITSKMPSFFNEKQLPLHCGQEVLGRVLRKKVVQEWLLNPQDYQGFLTSSTVEEEAPKFLQEGFYHGDLANTMVLAVSNSLGIPVVVFSSALHHPVIFITPRAIQVSVPILLAFTQYGPGHYSGICTKDDEQSTTQPTKSKRYKCFCGRSDKNTSQEHCIVTGTKYGTRVRCQCVRSEVKCTEQCRCKNCKNPFGSHQPSTPETRKNREKHNWQKKLIRVLFLLLI